MRTQQVVNAVALTLLAGTVASAAVTVDGKITAGDAYGAAKWVNTVPTGFGDNFAGAGGVLGDGSAVTTGVEFTVPYAAIGYTGGVLKMTAFVAGGGGFLSNQFLPSIVLNTGNLGSPERNVNLDLISGNQFASFTPDNVTTPVLVDGTRDASYGAAKAVQTNYTQFGNATSGNAILASGSEIDGLYVVRNDTTQTLTVLITGNLENNGNRLSVFFDTVAGGQNRILQATGWNGLLGNLGSDGGTNGFTFDAGFEADYAVCINCSGSPTPTIFVDTASFPTDSSPVPAYAGSSAFPTGVEGYDAPAVTPGDVGAPAVRVAINNINTAGVGGSPVALGNAAPNQWLAYGSEFDAVYSKVEGGKLFVLVTGNLESSFNKAAFFFDVAAGGQNRLRGPSDSLIGYVGNTGGDFGALQNMGGLAADTVLIDPQQPELGYTNTSGLKFDTGFAADYFLNFGNGGTTPENVNLFVNAAVLRTSGRRQQADGSPMDYSAYDGGLVNGNPPTTEPSPVDFAGPIRNLLLDESFGFPLSGEKETSFAPRRNADIMADPVAANRVPVANLITAKLDNSNVGGVTGTTASAAAAAAVTTGLEFSIDLAELGWDNTSEIKLAGFIANGGHNFLSNQIIGFTGSSTGGTGNAGDPRVVDFSNETNFPGNQWVSLTAATNPCPNPSNVSGPGQDTVTIDGELTADDIIVFLNRFFAGNLLSNVSGPGQDTVNLDAELTADDIIVFLNRFFAGC